MENGKIWFALVKVRPLQGNEILPKVKGAYVNIACISESEQTLREDIIEFFKYYLFKVITIEDIENEQSLIIENANKAEKTQLLNEINEGYQFAWGTFHTF